MERAVAASAPSAPDVGDHFLRRVRQAAAAVLGDSGAGRAVSQLCESHRAARHSLTTDRTGGEMVVAVVGPTGQGKSWLLRQFLRCETALQAIRSGNLLDDATERIVWVGGHPPADLDPRHEVYLHCAADRMRPMGVPYLIVDAPGATDARPRIAEIAQRVLAMADVLILVVRHDQLRSTSVDSLAVAGEGAIVIPVVNAIRRRDNELTADVDALTARIRAAAPSGSIAAAVLIDDFDLPERDESVVADAAIEAIAERIATELDRAGGAETRRAPRLAALDARFQLALCSLLGDKLPVLTGAVNRLRDAAAALPGEIAGSLIGGGASLQAAIRSRLRAKLLADTAAVLFPYRSLIGLLSLTSGAWDRVVLSLAGSLPSLIGAAWTGAQNVSAGLSANREIREGLKQRADAVVADRLGPLVARFRDELARLRGRPGGHPRLDIREHRALPSGEETASRMSSDDETHWGNRRSRVEAHLAGIDALQEESQRIFDEAIQTSAVGRRFTFLAGLIGTVVFWALMSGPIVALYRTYFEAGLTTLRDLRGNLDAFPRPEAAMLLTALLLSLLPTAVFAMFVVAWAQSRGRVARAEKRIREEHLQTIARLQRDSVLRLRWDDPLLADAEFLLSAGESFDPCAAEQEQAE